MDFPSTASGEHEGKPLLVLSPVPDQDHPDTMNQIVWSLMNLLTEQGIEGVPFDKENESSYNRVRVAISQMITASASVKATLEEVRAGSNDTKFVTSLGAVAASGNYSEYISVTTTPAVIAGSAMGSLIVASGSAAAITLPNAQVDVPRVGAAYTFLNLADGNVTIVRYGTNTILGVAGSTTAVTLRPGQQITLVRITSSVWAAIGASTNQHVNDNTIPAGCAIWFPSRAAIETGYIPSDGQILTRTDVPRIVTKLGVLPVVTDANWIATPANRGSYSYGDGATTIRAPDYNGKYAGDVALFLRGDGGNAPAAGQIAADTIKAHVHGQTHSSVDLAASTDGSLQKLVGGGSSSSNTLSTGTSETAPYHVGGVWCIKL